MTRSDSLCSISDRRCTLLWPRRRCPCLDQCLSLTEFTIGSAVTYGASRLQSSSFNGLTTDKLLILPTGPHERSTKEIERYSSRSFGYSSYGGGAGGRDRIFGHDSNSGRGSSRVLDEPRMRPPWIPGNKTRAMTPQTTPLRARLSGPKNPLCSHLRCLLSCCGRPSCLEPHLRRQCPFSFLLAVTHVSPFASSESTSSLTSSPTQLPSPLPPARSPVATWSDVAASWPPWLCHHRTPSSPPSILP